MATELISTDNEYETLYVGSEMELMWPPRTKAGGAQKDTYQWRRYPLCTL
jgi:hypothetical protein